MKFDDFFKKLNVETPDIIFEPIFEKAKEEYEMKGVFFLEDGYVDRVNGIFGCLSNCCNELKKAVILARDNDDIALYALFVYRAMMNREVFKKHLSTFVFPSGQTLEYDFLPMIILVPAIPELYNTLKQRKVPDDIIEATLRQFDDCTYIYQERFDKLGLNKRYFDYLQHYVDADTLNIERLRFEMNAELKSSVVVLKNKKNELAILFDDVEINSAGMLSGTPPEKDDEEYFKADVIDEEEYFEGYRALDNGCAEKTLTRFSKDEWELVLKKGDSVLYVHIPNKGALTTEACEKSYERAREVFAKCYPEFKYKAFYSHTWMFDTQLKEFLPSHSNILNFQKKYIFFAAYTRGEDVFNFVFKLKFKEYKDMPEDTSLQRGIKRHYLDGKYIYEFGGFFL